MYRILLVEDDGTICERISNHLQRWGYEVESVKDFGNVLADFARFNPQLVLMDI